MHFTLKNADENVAQWVLFLCAFSNTKGFPPPRYIIPENVGIMMKNYQYVG